MEKWKIFNVVGGILILIGAILAANSILTSDRSQTENEEIEPYYLTYFESTSEIAGGSLSGHFSVYPGTIDFYIFTKEQFDIFVDTGDADFVYHGSGSSGDFSVSFPTTGVYYIVASHAPAYVDITQQLTLTYVMKGLALTNLLIGIVVLAIGAVLIVIGLKVKGKENVEHENMLDDVTMFDDKKGDDGVKAVTSEEIGYQPIQVASPAPRAKPSATNPQVTKTRTVRKPPQPPT